MTEFAEVEREEIAVQFVRVPDGIEHIRRAWAELEAVVDLRGRHFYGAFDPVADDYRACVEVREGDEPVTGLEHGSLPGGRYLRARLRGEPPAVYERIGPTFDELVRERKPDDRPPTGRAGTGGRGCREGDRYDSSETRPSLEHYRRHDEIDLLLPI